MWEHELAVARAAAAEAGRAAAALQRGVERTTKSDGSPVTAGDLAADAAIKRCIHAAFPNDHIFSEEVADNHARLAQQRVWIIDPIDGTRAYVENREEWCVQVAFVYDGRAAVGVLDLPSRTMQMWATPSGAGISEGGHERSLTAMAGVRNVMAASSSERNRPHLERVRAALPEFAWLPANSVGFKAAQVLLGEADLFVHPRSIAEWDACAPAAVIAGAGAQATDLAGQPLRYNTASGKVPGLIFSRRDDHQRIVSRLAAAGIVLP